jgi:hypothetical protein
METERYDIPLMVCRGYASISYLHDAAIAISEQDKPTYIYYFGDSDPSGKDIERNTEKRLRQFSNAEIHFKRIAVTDEQIRNWNLPTRPTKSSDPRASRFQGESVEVDAIPVEQLRELTKNAIEEHLNKRSLEILEKIEEVERSQLTEFARKMYDASRVSRACFVLYPPLRGIYLNPIQSLLVQNHVVRYMLHGSGYIRRWVRSFFAKTSLQRCLEHLWRAFSLKVFVRVQVYRP